MTDERRPMSADEEAEALARLQEQIQRMTVSDHLVYMLESLTALATRKLGLAPGAGEERDLEQARLAIDAFRALLQVAEPTRPEQEVGVHRQMLSHLQMAYVHVLQGPPAGEPEARPEATEPEDAGAGEDASEVAEEVAAGEEAPSGE